MVSYIYIYIANMNNSTRYSGYGVQSRIGRDERETCEEHIHVCLLRPSLRSNVWQTQVGTGLCQLEHVRVRLDSKIDSCY